ncbi:unnamed protein product, partial [Prorocentrum cordatum]
PETSSRAVGSQRFPIFPRVSSQYPSLSTVAPRAPDKAGPEGVCLFLRNEFKKMFPNETFDRRAPLDEWMNRVLKGVGAFKHNIIEDLDFLEVFSGHGGASAAVRKVRRSRGRCLRD